MAIPHWVWQKKTKNLLAEIDQS